MLGPFGLLNALKDLSLQTGLFLGTVQLPDAQASGQGHDQNSHQPDEATRSERALSGLTHQVQTPNGLGCRRRPGEIIIRMKVFIILLLVGVLVALAGAGIFMLRKRQAGDGQANNAMARALALRVALSVGVFLLLLVSWYFGWIKPTGIPMSANG